MIAVMARVIPVIYSELSPFIECKFTRGYSPPSRERLELNTQNLEDDLGTVEFEELWPSITVM